VKEFVAACVQIAVAPNDVQANVDKGVAWLKTAVKEYGAELVVFPETVTTSFVTGLDANGLWDLVDEAPDGSPVTCRWRPSRWASTWCGRPTGAARSGAWVYNSAILIGPDGEIIGIYDKTHPFPLERATAAAG